MQKIYDFFFKTLFTFPFGFTISSKFVSIQCIRMKVIQSYGAENLLHYRIEKDYCYFWPDIHNNDADNCFFPISHFYFSITLCWLLNCYSVRNFPCIIYHKRTLAKLNEFLADPEKNYKNSPAYNAFCSVYLEWFHIVFPKWNIYQNE